MTATESVGERVRVTLTRPTFWVEWASVVGLVLLVVLFTALDSTFLSAGNIRGMLLASAILTILVVGQAFVILTAGIDLSVASVMTFAAVMFGLAMTHGYGILLSCLVAFCAGAAVGLLNGVLVAKGRITDFIVTLGALSAASGTALILSDGKPITVISAPLFELSAGSVGVVPYTFMIALLIAVLAHVVLFKTKFGTHVLATGGSVEAAQATGIRTTRIKIAVYAISGSLAGIAAILLVARVGSAEPAANMTFLLNSVAAVVLGGVSLFGGKGSIKGPIFGALLLTALSNGLTLLGVSQFYQPLAVGVVVVGAAFLTRFDK
ncbi:ABC transporter permease [Ornithinimicrobium cavernae]|uniref:ABC transporter permease n=1 Tax=Ornithinimicrobium cavernae TaxID=2666047 RepID=UPI000D69F0D8|nr:ABC transporter permease [Ornithinimicrobium cavernae]